MNLSDLSLSYCFSPQEILILARFFRKNTAKLPKGLEKFSKKIEDTVYQAMTLEEVQNFYEKEQ